MFKRRAWVAPSLGSDLHRLAKQKAQNIQVMHRHIRQRQAVIISQKPLPMRDREHVDLRKHDLAQIAAINNLFQHPHRLVVAHVLIDTEHLPAHAAASRKAIASARVSASESVRPSVYE
jgi:hypothetical protein